MFQYLTLLLLSASEYGAPQAHQDSMFIYKTYAESVKVFEQATEPSQWKAESENVARLTAVALFRLGKYNKQSYEPVDELNKEGVGVAYAYPQPSSYDPTASAKSNADSKGEIVSGNAAPGSEKEIAFKVLDPQTHFLIGNNGKGRVPYVTMNYYAKGRILVKSEKLNPVTLQPLEADGPGLTTSSN